MLSMSKAWRSSTLKLVYNECYCCQFTHSSSVCPHINVLIHYAPEDSIFNQKPKVAQHWILAETFLQQNSSVIIWFVKPHDCTLRWEAREATDKFVNLLYWNNAETVQLLYNTYSISTNTVFVSYLKGSLHNQDIKAFFKILLFAVQMLFCGGRSRLWQSGILCWDSTIMLNYYNVHTCPESGL